MGQTLPGPSDSKIYCLFVRIPLFEWVPVTCWMENKYTFLLAAFNIRLLRLEMEWNTDQFEFVRWKFEILVGLSPIAIKSIA